MIQRRRRFPHRRFIVAIRRLGMRIAHQPRVDEIFDVATTVAYFIASPATLRASRVARIFNTGVASRCSARASLVAMPDALAVAPRSLASRAAAVKQHLLNACSDGNMILSNCRCGSGSSPSGRPNSCDVDSLAVRHDRTPHQAADFAEVTECH